MNINAQPSLSVSRNLLDEAACLNYHLPPALIAQRPSLRRGNTRLLALCGTMLQDLRFFDIVNFLHAGDVLVFNTSRVLKARLFGRRDTGGRVEILLEQLLPSGEALAQIRASHRLPIGTRIHLSRKIHLLVTAHTEFYTLRPINANFEKILRDHGKLPLPPYIHRTADAADARRYQNVFAEEPGSVAAPTAGLHFTQSLLKRIANKGVLLAPLCLHVGAGTFAPVRDLQQHKMHVERFNLPAASVQLIRKAKRNNCRVIAVGTTSMRVLETAAQSGELRAGVGQSQLFIRPGFQFQIVDALITNFHQPHTSLLLLVAAFIGTDNLRRTYEHAIDQRYRFLSYGDAMFLDPRPQS